MSAFNPRELGARLSRLCTSGLWKLRRRASALDTAGALAAAVLFVALNILAARFFSRWDVTTARLFTLSEPTKATLGQLVEPLEVVVLMSRTEPLSRSVAALLEEYQAASSHVRTRFIDPDRNPAEFFAAQREFGLLEGRSQDGRLASEASIVLVRGARHWFVTTDDIIAYDEHAESAQPRLEQVLTEGIAQLVGQRREVACFARGGQELGADSAGPQGLGEFRRYLERNNTEVRTVDLALAKLEGALRGCDLTFAVGATKPYSPAAARELARWIADGGALLLALGPIADDEGRIIPPGLDAVLDPLGVRAGNNAVFETDAALRLPVGIGGEVFLATPKPHAVTAGMLRGEEVRHRVLLQLAQSFDVAQEGIAKPLLVTSSGAEALHTFRGLMQGSSHADTAEVREFTMAVAGEYQVHGGSPHPDRRGRVIAVGTPSVLWSSTWQDPALVGTRRFVESAVAWLAADKPLVSVPEKPAVSAGLALTAEAMGEVRRYVLLYLPLTLAAVGALIVWGRRRESRAAGDV